MWSHGPHPYPPNHATSAAESLHRLRRSAVDHFAEIIGKLLAADPPPWTTFPKPPCRTADAFFRLCGGMTQEQTAAVLAACGHTNLADVVRDL